MIDHAKTARDVLVVTVESAPTVMGCPTGGVVAHRHGRRTVTMVDTPCFGKPTQVRWRKRTWECVEPSCPKGVFTEHNEQIGRRRGLLTTRACLWAIDQLAGEHASILGIPRQLDVSTAYECSSSAEVSTFPHPSVEEPQTSARRR